MAPFYGAPPMALLIFLQLDVHHWLLRAVIRSFTYFPVGGSVLTLLAVSLSRLTKTKTKADYLVAGRTLWPQHDQ